MVRIRDNYYIQIVRFHCVDGDAQALADKIARHIDDWISDCDGFVSANLHVSIDGKDLINYAQWRDKESFFAYKEHDNHTQLRKDIDEISPSRADSDAFELVAQKSIEDEFWSKSRI
uniref:antibiotic biosynthesis monooxygenase family protein n=1 Tax=Ningiella ruwaisensis TaxID=2364274 RepID=UPI00109F264C|nr:antibiotic biosynthesis monooxygenase [Ningiella ruwaisensis]